VNSGLVTAHSILDVFDRWLRERTVGAGNQNCAGHGDDRGRECEDVISRQGIISVLSKV
jgi:hypothetical protein